MRRTELEEGLFEWEVEDQAINFLRDMPALVAASIAVTAARSACDRWEIEKSEMLKRDDPRPVWKFSRNRMVDLEIDTPAVGINEIRAVAHLLSLFANLPADGAAMVAIIVAEWAVDRAKRSKL